MLLAVRGSEGVRDTASTVIIHGPLIPAGSLGLISTRDTREAVNYIKSYCLNFTIVF